MPWVRFDDQYPIHRKVARLSDPAFRLHSAAIFWCTRNGTDGFVSEEDLDLVCAQVRTPERFAAECVKRGTWHVAAHACESENCPAPRDEPGWVIHDYLEYQPTKEEAEAAEKKHREQKSSGGKLGNHRRWHAQRGVKDPECPWCAPPDSSVSDRYPIGGSDRSPIAPSRPAPTSGSVVSHLQVPDARAIDDGLTKISAALASKAGRIVTPDETRHAVSVILGRAERSGNAVRHPVSYVLGGIAEEPDVYVLLLDEPPPLAEILADFAPPDGTHAFDEDPDTGLCRECKTPESNWHHPRPSREGMTAHAR